MIAKLAYRFSVLLAVSIATAAIAAAAGPVIIFENNSGAPALVKLVGLSSGVVEVPNGSTRSLEIRSGMYYLLVRYGAPGNYLYTRGDPFAVTEISTGTGYRYSVVTITLHKVVNGNYGSRQSSASEFEAH